MLRNTPRTSRDRFFARLAQVALPSALLTVGLCALPACNSEASSASSAPSVSVLPPQGRPFDAPPLAPASIASADDPLEKKIGRDEFPEVAPPLAGATDKGEETNSEQSAEPSGDGPRELSFKELASFEYETVDPLSMLKKGGPPPKTDIPEKIQGYSGMRVKVDGFLMPTIFESGKVQQFLLTRSYITCCFGDVLNMNEVIDVTVGDDLEVSYFLSGQPVTVTGWLEVGEKTSDFGYVESIYRIVGEEVVERW